MNSTSPFPRRRGTSRLLRVVKFSGFAAVLLLTLITLIYAALGFWGRRQWAETKRALQEKGEPLSLAELIPPKIPDELNFFATPSWRKLLSNELAFREGKITSEALKKENPFEVLKPFYKASRPKKRVIPPDTAPSLFFERLDLDAFAQALHPGAGPVSDPPVAILEAMKLTAPLMDELESATSRPGAWLPIDYDETFAMPIPHIAPGLAACQFLNQRAVVYMAAGDSAKAAADIRLIFRIADALAPEPFLISKLVRTADLAIAAMTFWECSSRRTWTDAELVPLQRLFEDCDVFQDLANGIRGERGTFNSFLAGKLSRADLARMFLALANEADRSSKWRQLAMYVYPHGLLLADQAFFNQHLQAAIDALTNHRLDALPLWNRSSQLSETPSDWLHPLSSELIRGTFKGLEIRAADTQIQLDFAVLSCALQRYRLAHGEFPASLTQLVPAYLKKIPVTPGTEDPVTYRRLAADNFELRSPALLPDTSGVRQHALQKRVRANGGDWVARFQPWTSSS